MLMMYQLKNMHLTCLNIWVLITMTEMLLLMISLFLTSNITVETNLTMMEHSDYLVSQRPNTTNRLV
ncbi:MAG: hypothetical protein EOM35_09180 [Negativicutes bacterium]|nr:hypothetical protein [Negativicutes bacterium]